MIRAAAAARSVPKTAWPSSRTVLVFGSPAFLLDAPGTTGHQFGINFLTGRYQRPVNLKCDFTTESADRATDLGAR